MPKLKNILIFTSIAVIFAVVFYIFFVKSSPEEGNLVVSSPEETIPVPINSTGSLGFSEDKTAIAKDFLSLLLNVRNIKLSDALLSDPAFLNLRDSSIVLVPDGNEGRPNPFAKFGNDNFPVSTIPAETTPTVEPNSADSSAPVTPVQ